MPGRLSTTDRATRRNRATIHSRTQHLVRNLLGRQSSCLPQLLQPRPGLVNSCLHVADDNQNRHDLSRKDYACPFTVPKMPRMEVPADFGARLRAARAYADMSREDFAKRLNTSGLSASTIKAYETGVTAPGPLAVPELVARLADASGLPESFFLGGDTSSIETQLAAIEKTVGEIHDLNVHGFAAIESLIREPPKDEEQRRRRRG